MPKDIIRPPLFSIFEKDYSDKVKSFSKSKWTGLIVQKKYCWDFHYLISNLSGTLQQFSTQHFVPLWTLWRRVIAGDVWQSGTSCIECSFRNTFISMWLKVTLLIRFSVQILYRMRGKCMQIPSWKGWAKCSLGSYLRPLGLYGCLECRVCWLNQVYCY